MTKRWIVLAAAVFVWLVAAACVEMPEAGQSEVVTATAASLQPAASRDNETSAPAETPTPSASTIAGGQDSPQPEALQQNNVSASGKIVVSAGEETARLAVDEDLDSLWNSSRLPLGWFLLTLDGPHLVHEVELVVAQSPAGPTVHEVWLGDGTGTRALYERLDHDHTEDGQTLSVTVAPPRMVGEVLVRTVESKSWVAWREIRVLGEPYSGPAPEAGLPQLRLERIAAGFELPVRISHAGDGSGQLFVVEQSGRIFVIRNSLDADGEREWSVSDVAFLDITKRVSCCGERGLYDIAFPTNYVAKQYFYVSYTNQAGDNVISRFKTNTDPERADADSEEILLTIPQPHDTHNGGRITFGPLDGYLYIGSGDGGPSYDDLDNNGQDPSTLLGAILRIDVEGNLKPYGIPEDNPFINIDGYRDEIWATGLRNPWGFAFHEETGGLFIPDVGHLTREEVNYQPPSSGGGENYGWRIMEGSGCFEHRVCTEERPCSVEPWICSAEGLISPVAEYDRPPGCAVVGGAVYRGAGSGAEGTFLYGDFCSGRIWGLRRPVPSRQDRWESRLLLEAAVPVSSIGEDEEGNVYVVGYGDGAVYLVSEGQFVDDGTP